VSNDVDHYLAIFRSEKPEVTREAIAAVDGVEPAGEEHAAKLARLREGLMQHLLDAPQGSLF
jgi:peptide deformylase